MSLGALISNHQGKKASLDRLRYDAALSSVQSCNCIGPQNGQPVCPCAMRGVTIEDGRYVQKRDLWPAN